MTSRREKTETDCSTIDFVNSYEDVKRAEAYAELEFPGTYYLAYRDLPGIIRKHVKGEKALDFGCGTGRSTRFLRRLGFDVIGVDISRDMLEKATELDPQGIYRLIEEGRLEEFESDAYDLVLSAFTFDNVPTMQRKVRNFRELARLLNSQGRIINLVSSPEIYIHEWASFSTKNFKENKKAKSGDKVRIIQTDIVDKRPVEDVLWTDEYYQKTYRKAGLASLAKFKPLANANERYKWINETKIPPWTIYILKRLKISDRKKQADKKFPP